MELIKASLMAAVMGGGGANLGTKTITANGTYAASDDSLDGYSEVTVNVPSGIIAEILTFPIKATGTITGAWKYELRYGNFAVKRPILTMSTSQGYGAAYVDKEVMPCELWMLIYSGDTLVAVYSIGDFYGGAVSLHEKNCQTYSPSSGVWIPFTYEEYTQTEFTTTATIGSMGGASCSIGISWNCKAHHVVYDSSGAITTDETVTRSGVLSTFIPYTGAKCYSPLNESSYISAITGLSNSIMHAS